MQVIVNGDSKEFKDSATLKEVVDSLGIEDKVMAAAVNMSVVKRDDWGKCSLKNSDKIELLNFVSGG